MQCQGSCDYLQGGRQGYVRFTAPSFVQEAVARGDADGIVPLESVKASVKVISDQEEKDFYHRVMPLQHLTCIACIASNSVSTDVAIAARSDCHGSPALGKHCGSSDFALGSFSSFFPCFPQQAITRQKADLERQQRDNASKRGFERGRGGRFGKRGRLH